MYYTEFCKKFWGVGVRGRYDPNKVNTYEYTNKGDKRSLMTGDKFNSCS
jgi:hypothetical protein